MSTLVAEAPSVVPPPRRKKRRRRRFSLNGLAIQLSAFALSFTLVALLVVSGSQQAFVEENETVTNYVPIGTTAAPSGGHARTHAPIPPTAAPTTSEPAASMPSTVIRLVDSDAGTAMFGTETTLVPGVPSARCIEVDYSGNAGAPSPVRLYAASTAGSLARYLDLRIEVGAATSGAFGSCAAFVPEASLYRGTLADFAAAHPGYAAGVRTWQPTEKSPTRAFRFTVGVQDVAVAEGKSVSFGFSWETRDGS